jgi:signal transduction histidine kinase
MKSTTPLTIIAGQIAVLELDLQKDKPIPKEKWQKGFETVKNTLQRIVKIIKGLRSIARDGQGDPFMPESLTEIILEMIAIVSEKFKNNGVQLEYEPNPELPPINARKVQLSQVILNLISNSYDAICGLNEKWIKITSELLDDKIIIYITDSGKGISEEVQEKIFQPFFTTKEIGKGTGIGLSVSQGIVEEHSGELYYNNLSENTQFVIELPILGANLMGDSSDENDDDATDPFFTPGQE